MCVSSLRLRTKVYAVSMYKRNCTTDTKYTCFTLSRSVRSQLKSTIHPHHPVDHPKHVYWWTFASAVAKTNTNFVAINFQMMDSYEIYIIIIMLHKKKPEHNSSYCHGVQTVICKINVLYIIVTDRGLTASCITWKGSCMDSLGTSSGKWRGYSQKWVPPILARSLVTLCRSRQEVREDGEILVIQILPFWIPKSSINAKRSLISIMPNEMRPSVIFFRLRFSSVELVKTYRVYNGEGLLGYRAQLWCTSLPRIDID